MPAGIQKSRNKLITWSSRTPFACRAALRIASTKGSQPAARNFQGSKAGTPQSCPSVKNSSGGAPTRMPGASRCCHLHASKPSAARDLVAIRISKPLRPIAPGRADRFRQRVETGEVEEGIPFTLCPRHEPTGLGGRSKDQLQRLRLELKDLAVIDEAVCVERARRRTQWFELGRALLGSGHILDAD